METIPREANRLVHESSPYLLQHAYNPVDWYPWSEEALEASNREDKPILLSIGYSACHWCHVMERESFENPSIARLMNQDFINIKVDREERPDLDAIYMAFVQATTGSGGWPLTVFLEPDQTPFFGGTYFPPEDRYGRPGFGRILAQIAEVYQTRRDDLRKQRVNVLERLDSFSKLGGEAGRVDQLLLESSFQGHQSQFDQRHGGFGGAPKFPSSLSLGFLLRYAIRSPGEPALEMTEKSLNAMSSGGIYDQLGGGFHRYSVDEQWLVPHFEKMLYDNALLAQLYTEAFQVTQKSLYRRVAEETLEYVEREMLSPEGAFYSAQDADSEGAEGTYYVWTTDQVESLFESAKEAKTFCDYFGISTAGNFEGANVLSRCRDSDWLAGELEMSEPEALKWLQSHCLRLRKEREKRVCPGLDNKVLAAWNGLMATAFGKAGFVFGREDFLEIARRNAQFLASEMVDNGRVSRTWKEGTAKLNGFLDDYAAIVESWLTLFESTGETTWLFQAEELMERQIENFWDAEEGSFFFTSHDHETLLIRQKEYFDNATPSGNSISCLNLLRLGTLLGRSDYRKKAETMLSRVSQIMGRVPTAFGNWLQALDYYFGPVREIVIVGSTPDRVELTDVLRRQFLPNSVRVLTSQGDSSLSKQIPLLEGKENLSKAQAFVCQDQICGTAIETPEALAEELTP